MQSFGDPDGRARGRPECCTGCIHYSVALLNFDDVLLKRDFAKRAENDQFSEWSTPILNVAAAVSSKRTGKRQIRDNVMLADSRGSQRSLTYNEDEWMLRYKQPYWRTMVDSEEEYIPNNGCYRCMKLRNFPEDFDSFKFDRPAREIARSEPRQLQREVTKDLRRQFRLVVQGKEPVGNVSTEVTAATQTHGTMKKHVSTSVQDQPIIEDENEESFVVEKPLLSQRIQQMQVTGALLATVNALSVHSSFQPPAVPEILYEIPSGGLSILDEYSAKDLATLTGTLSRVPDVDDKLSFNDKLIAFDKQLSKEVKILQNSKNGPPAREAFVLADDALRVRKLTRKKDLKPVEKVTPKFRQMEDSTKLASTLAKLKYTTANGSIVSMPVYASGRSQSASLSADSEPGKLNGVIITRQHDGTPFSVPTSPEVKIKPKGKKTDTKGFALPGETIQEMCLPEIAGIRIPTLSGSRR